MFQQQDRDRKTKVIQYINRLCSILLNRRKCFLFIVIWLGTTQIVREETHCCHIGYSFQLTARVLLYVPSHSLCYTCHGALAGTRNSSMGLPHEVRSDDPSHHERKLLPWSYILLPLLIRLLILNLYASFKIGWGM